MAAAALPLNRSRRAKGTAQLSVSVAALPQQAPLLPCICRRVVHHIGRLLFPGHPPRTCMTLTG